MANSVPAHHELTIQQNRGDVQRVIRSSRLELRVLDERNELIVIGLILESPTLYSDEVCRKVCDLTSLTVSPPSICQMFKCYGLTRKRVRQIASQRCDALRGAFMSQCCLFTRDKFVWVDETGSDARDHIRRYGYAIRGCRPVPHRSLSRV